jgi:hypothetical protein
MNHLIQNTNASFPPPGSFSPHKPRSLFTGTTYLLFRITPYSLRKRPFSRHKPQTSEFIHRYLFRSASFPPQEAFLTLQTSEFIHRYLFRSALFPPPEAFSTSHFINLGVYSAAGSFSKGDTGTTNRSRPQTSDKVF